MSKHPGRWWSPHEIDRLFYLRDVERKRWSEIAAALCRTQGSCAVTYSNKKLGRLPRLESVKTIARPSRAKNVHYLEPKPDTKPTSRLFAERDYRALAADLRDLTASFCGDPPPGYSALDQKRNAGA